MHVIKCTAGTTAGSLHKVLLVSYQMTAKFLNLALIGVIAGGSADAAATVTVTLLGRGESPLAAAVW